MCEFVVDVCVNCVPCTADTCVHVSFYRGIGLSRDTTYYINGIGNSRMTGKKMCVEFMMSQHETW